MSISTPKTSRAANRVPGLGCKAWPMLTLVLLLLAAQWLLSSHQVQHLSSGSDHRVCEVCLIGGGMHHGAVSGIDAIPFLATYLPTPAVLQGISSGHFPLRQLIRGPPSAG